MSSSEDLQDALAEVSRFFVSDATITDTLLRIAQLAVEAMEPAEFAGMTLLSEGEVATGVFTDAQAPEIDQAQYDTNSGPCLESYRTGEIMRINSTAEVGPWPEFRTACYERGIMSTASFPMSIDGVVYGALNMYSCDYHAFGANEIRAGRSFAAQAGVVVAYARSYWDARHVSEQLEEALSSRAAIEQAKGIIIATTGVSAEQAFEILVEQSTEQDRTVRDVATELVRGTSTRRERPDDERPT